MTMVTRVMPNNLFKQLNMTWCQVVTKTIMCGFTLKIKLCSHFIVI